MVESSMNFVVQVDICWQTQTVSMRRRHYHHKCGLGLNMTWFVCYCLLLAAPTIWTFVQAQQAELLFFPRGSTQSSQAFAALHQPPRPKTQQLFNIHAKHNFNTNAGLLGRIRNIHRTHSSPPPPAMAAARTSVVAFSGGWPTPTASPPTAPLLQTPTRAHGVWRQQPPQQPHHPQSQHQRLQPSVTLASTQLSTVATQVLTNKQSSSDNPRNQDRGHGNRDRREGEPGQTWTGNTPQQQSHVSEGLRIFGLAIMLMPMFWW